MIICRKIMNCYCIQYRIYVVQYVQQYVYNTVYNMYTMCSKVYNIVVDVYHKTFIEPIPD